MNGYILTPTTNTNGWVVYENDISLDYKEFFKGELLPSEELPLFYDIPKSSNLKTKKNKVGSFFRISRSRISKPTIKRSVRNINGRHTVF